MGRSTPGDEKDGALKNTVTVRHRDNMAQERVAISEFETCRREKMQ